MEVTYRPATLRDIDLLLALRMVLLREANGLSPQADMRRVEAENRRYFLDTLETPAQKTWLAFVDGQPAGCGSVVFIDNMPTYHCPTGQWAYIMNIYTHPACRRRGIAREMMARLLAEAKSRGCERILLEATDEGKPLYRQCGFEAACNEMEYTPETPCTEEANADAGHAPN